MNELRGISSKYTYSFVEDSELSFMILEWSPGAYGLIPRNPELAAFGGQGFLYDLLLYSLPGTVPGTE